MKKLWKKPICDTLLAKDLFNYIKAAAWSGEGICDSAVFR